MRACVGGAEATASGLRAELVVGVEMVALRACTPRAVWGELGADRVPTEGRPASIVMILGVGPTVPAGGAARGTGRFPRDADRTGGAGGFRFRTLMAGEGGSRAVAMLSAEPATRARTGCGESAPLTMEGGPGCVTGAGARVWTGTVEATDGA